MPTEFHLILPNIRSCFNVGAMFRTADACGVDKLWLVGYTAGPPDPKIAKVSLGAETWVPFAHSADLHKLIAELKADGFKIIGLEKTESSNDIGTCDNSGKVVLIVGNEIDGINPATQKLCDQVVHIPMYGRKESLNVSVAAGIAMYLIKNKI